MCFTSLRFKNYWNIAKFNTFYGSVVEFISASVLLQGLFEHRTNTTGETDKGWLSPFFGTMLASSPVLKDDVLKYVEVKGSNGILAISHRFATN